MRLDPWIVRAMIGLLLGLSFGVAQAGATETSTLEAPPEEPRSCVRDPFAGLLALPMHREPDECSSPFACANFVDDACRRRGSRPSNVRYLRAGFCSGTCADGKRVGGDCDIFRRRP